MPRHGAIFDLDGTLLDSLLDLSQSVNAALSQMGYSPRTIQEVRAFVGNGVDTLMARALPQNAKPGDVKTALSLFQAHYALHLNDRTRPYEGVLPLLEKLSKQGIAVGVVSNKYDAAVKALCRQYFGKLVKVAIGEGGDVRKKPAPEGTLKALRRLGCDPGHAVYIGDSDVDIVTAQNAGLPPISVDWGFRSRESLLAAGAQPQWIASTGEELFELIQRRLGLI